MLDRKNGMDEALRYLDSSTFNTLRHVLEPAIFVLNKRVNAGWAAKYYEVWWWREHSSSGISKEQPSIAEGW